MCLTKGIWFKVGPQHLINVASPGLLYMLTVVCMESISRGYPRSHAGPAHLSVACSRPGFTTTSHLAPGNEGALTPSTLERGKLHTQHLGTRQASHPAPGNEARLIPAPGNKASLIHTQHLGTRQASYQHQGTRRASYQHQGTRRAS